MYTLLQSRESCATYAAMAMVVLFGLASASAQDRQVAPSARSLGAMPQLSETRAAAGLEITIELNAAAPVTLGQAVTSPDSGAVRLIGSRPVTGGPSRQRAPKLSEDLLVVIAVDAAGRDVGWELVPDPSVLRAETADSTGSLVRHDLRRSHASFVITIPERTPAVGALRVYKPRWAGEGFVLDLVGSLAFPGVR